MLLIAVVSLVSGLSGCASYRGIHTEAIPQQQTDLEGGKDLAATLTRIDWPATTWWTKFNDEQLNTLIQTALKDSPTLKSAAARVRQAQAVAESARQAALPQASGSISSERELFTGHGLVDPPGAGNWFFNNSAVVKASYDIDLWGRDESELAAAIGSVHVSQAETRSAQLSLESTIVRTYLKLAQAFVSRDIERDTLQQQRDVVRIAEHAYRAGVGTRLDLNDAQTPIPQSEAAEKALDEQIALLRQQLAVLTGHGPGAGDNLVRPVLSDVLKNDQIQNTLLPGLPDQIPANLIGRRPDVIAQRWRVESITHTVDAIQAGFYPNINLSAFAGFESLDFTQWFSAVSAVRGATGAISLPFFSDRRAQGQTGQQCSTVRSGSRVL